MNDTATVLLAAFGGGLVGSVLQPIVDYFLSRLRANDEIRKQHERRIRQMIETEMTFVRYALRLLVVDQVRVSLGDDPDLRATWRRITDDRSALPIWQPNRIPDATVRKMAEELSDLPLRCVLVRGQGLEALRESRDRLGTIDARRSFLQDAIIAKMDELHWPEPA